eukprot:160988_1
MLLHLSRAHIRLSSSFTRQLCGIHTLHPWRGRSTVHQSFSRACSTAVAADKKSEKPSRFDATIARNLAQNPWAKSPTNSVKRETRPRRSGRGMPNEMKNVKKTGAEAAPLPSRINLVANCLSGCEEYLANEIRRVLTDSKPKMLVGRVSFSVADMPAAWRACTLLHCTSSISMELGSLKCNQFVHLENFVKKIDWSKLLPPCTIPAVSVQTNRSNKLFHGGALEARLQHWVARRVSLSDEQKEALKAADKHSSSEVAAVSGEAELAEETGNAEDYVYSLSDKQLRNALIKAGKSTEGTPLEMRKRLKRMVLQKKKEEIERQARKNIDIISENPNKHKGLSKVPASFVDSEFKIELKIQRNVGYLSMRIADNLTNRGYSNKHRQKAFRHRNSVLASTLVEASGLIEGKPRAIWDPFAACGTVMLETALMVMGASSHTDPALPHPEKCEFLFQKFPSFDDAAHQKQFFDTHGGDDSKLLVLDDIDETLEFPEKVEVGLGEEKRRKETERKIKLNNKRMAEMHTKPEDDGTWDMDDPPPEKEPEPPVNEEELVDNLKKNWKRETGNEKWFIVGNEHHDIPVKVARDNIEKCADIHGRGSDVSRMCRLVQGRFPDVAVYVPPAAAIISFLPPKLSVRGAERKDVKVLTEFGDMLRRRPDLRDVTVLNCHPDFERYTKMTWDSLTKIYDPPTDTTYSILRLNRSKSFRKRRLQRDLIHEKNPEKLKVIRQNLDQLEEDNAEEEDEWKRARRQRMRKGLGDNTKPKQRRDSNVPERSDAKVQSDSNVPERSDAKVQSDSNVPERSDAKVQSDSNVPERSDAKMSDSAPKDATSNIQEGASGKDQESVTAESQNSESTQEANDQKAPLPEFPKRTSDTPNEDDMTPEERAKNHVMRMRENDLEMQKHENKKKTYGTRVRRKRRIPGRSVKSKA